MTETAQLGDDVASAPLAWAPARRASGDTTKKLKN
jgi:hypothetical protein